MPWCQRWPKPDQHPTAPLAAAHLEGGEKELSWRQLQESNPGICHRSLQEEHQLLAEAEAAADGNTCCQQPHQHTLTQLL
jgi:hypothetical protein